MAGLARGLQGRGEKCVGEAGGRAGSKTVLCDAEVVATGAAGYLCVSTTPCPVCPNFICCPVFISHSPQPFKSGFSICFKEVKGLDLAVNQTKA